MYAIDDADGTQITSGLGESDARETAQRIADRRGEAVYLYPVAGGDAADRDATPEEILPTA